MTAENGPLISSSEAPAMYPSPKRGRTAKMPAKRARLVDAARLNGLDTGYGQGESGSHLFPQATMPRSLVERPPGSPSG
jgi:hypothetical protein